MNKKITIAPNHFTVRLIQGVRIVFTNDTNKVKRFEITEK